MWVPYRDLRIVSYNTKNTIESTKTRWQPMRRATARTLPGAAAACGRFFLPASARSLSLLGSVRWADAALKTHAGRSYGNAAIDVLRELVVFACFWRCRATKNWVSGGLDCF